MWAFVGDGMSGLFLGKLYEICMLVKTVGRYRLVCMSDREKIREREEENSDRLFEICRTAIPLG
jgi:hypothetical protein